MTETRVVIRDQILPALTKDSGLGFLVRRLLLAGHDARLRARLSFLAAGRLIFPALPARSILHLDVVGAFFTGGIGQGRRTGEQARHADKCDKHFHPLLLLVVINPFGKSAVLATLSRIARIRATRPSTRESLARWPSPNDSVTPFTPSLSSDPLLSRWLGSWTAELISLSAASCCCCAVWARG
jgi:hypothetical protein